MHTPLANVTSHVGREGDWRREEAREGRRGQGQEKRDWDDDDGLQQAVIACATTHRAAVERGGVGNGGREGGSERAWENGRKGGREEAREHARGA